MFGVVDTTLNLIQSQIFVLIRQRSPMMAMFFNLANNPNQSIKSKTDGTFLRIPGPPRGFIVPDDWDVKPGDVISWSDYRASETYL